MSLKTLLEAGCHFGHKTDRWHPKAASFIYQAREGIHIIDLAKTKKGLENAAEFLRNAALRGEGIVFVGTKRQSKSVVKEEATRVGAPFLTERWVGGFLTNWEGIHKNLEKIRRMEEEKATDAWKKFPKHEQLKLDRHLIRLKTMYGGVVSLYNQPTVVVLADIRKEKLAVHEAQSCNATVIAIVDTNCDPSLVTYPIPANDDAVGSVKCLIHYLADAYAEGMTLAQKEKDEKAVATKETVAPEGEVKKKEKKNGSDKN